MVFKWIPPCVRRGWNTQSTYIKERLSDKTLSRPHSNFGRFRLILFSYHYHNYTLCDFPIATMMKREDRDGDANDSTPPPQPTTVKLDEVKGTKPLMSTKAHKGKQGHALFNTCFKTFLRDLSVRFPDVKEFKIMIGLYKVLKTLNVKIVHSMWRVASDPFLPDLMRHDDTFFLDPNIKLPDGFEIFIYMLPTLRKCWMDMDHEEQKNVWAHIDLLLSLSMSLAMESVCVKQQFAHAMKFF